MLLLFIAIIILIAVVYNFNNDKTNNKHKIKKLMECPDVLKKQCNINPCNCPDQRNKPKYKKTVNFHHNINDIFLLNHYFHHLKSS